MTHAAPGASLPPDGQIRLHWVHFVPDYLPLSLGMLLAYARTRLDPERFDLSPRFIASDVELDDALNYGAPGIFLFSDYIWNVDRHLAASARVKARSPASVTIHGGPSFPHHPDTCAAFLTEHRHVDFGAVGEGEKTVAELLHHLGAATGWPTQIAGLRFLTGERYVETSPRNRSVDLSEYPSPYLTGLFDQVAHRAIYAVLETNRGCPYGCTFCDWGSAILQKVRQFPLDRVQQEIEWICRNGMRDINITDANFGVFPRDVDICRNVCAAKERYGHPQRLIVNYAKSTHRHMLEIVDMMSSAGLVPSGTISIQTRDPDTLTAIRRRNIRTAEYDKLEEAFADRELPLDSQLMLGLPGATLASFKSDLRYYFTRNVNIRVFRTVLLVNSPMADPEYRALHKIVTDAEGMICSTATAPMGDLLRAEALARVFRCAHTYGMLRFVLAWLEWDYGLDPVDLLDTMIGDMSAADDHWRTRYSLLAGLCLYDTENETLVAGLNCVPSDAAGADRAVGPLRMIPATHIRFREMLRADRLWGEFYAQCAAYLGERHGIANDSAMAAALAAQEAVMPRLGQEYPSRVDLMHDFSRYFMDRASDVSVARLGRYTAGSLVVEDPLRLSAKGTYRQDWTLTDFWQLLSSLPGAGRSSLRQLVATLAAEDRAVTDAIDERVRATCF